MKNYVQNSIQIQCSADIANYLKSNQTGRSDHLSISIFNDEISIEGSSSLMIYKDSENSYIVDMQTSSCEDPINDILLEMAQLLKMKFEKSHFSLVNNYVCNDLSYAGFSVINFDKDDGVQDIRVEGEAGGYEEFFADETIDSLLKSESTRDVDYKLHLEVLFSYEELLEDGEPIMLSRTTPQRFMEAEGLSSYHEYFIEYIESNSSLSDKDLINELLDEDSDKSDKAVVIGIILAYARGLTSDIEEHDLFDEAMEVLDNSPLLVEEIDKEALSKRSIEDDSLNSTRISL